MVNELVKRKLHPDTVDISKYSPENLSVHPDIVMQAERMHNFPTPGSSLSEKINLGDFVKWAGYTRQELIFFHRLWVLQGGKLDFETYCKTYQEHMEKHHYYGIVEEIFRGEPIPTLRTFKTNIQGDLDTSALSFTDWDTVDHNSGWYQYRTKKVSKGEAINSLLGDILYWKDEIEPANNLDDSSRLRACIYARRIFRLAELYSALDGSDDTLKTIEKHREGSVVMPDTHLFVVTPEYTAFSDETKIDPHLLYFKRVPPSFRERDIADYIGVVTKMDNEQVVFAVPDFALHLCSGIDVSQFDIPEIQGRNIIHQENRAMPDSIQQVLVEKAGIK